MKNETGFNWKELTNALPGGIAYYRMDGDKLQLLYLTEGVARLSGHSKAEYEKLVEADVFAIVYEADRKRITERMWEAVRTRKTLNFSFRVYHKNGTLVWLNGSANILTEDNGGLLVQALYMGTSNEFHMYHDVSNTATNGCYVVSDTDYQILYVNQQLENFLQMKGVSEILGKKCYEVIQDRKEPCKNCAIYNKGTMERRGDRSKQIYKVSATEIEWDDKKATIVYLNNITEQRREEQHALDARQNLSIAMQHAKMIYWEYEFGESRAYPNETARKFFGVPLVVENYPDSFLDMNFVYEADVPAYRENVNRMKAGEEYIEFTIKTRTLQQEEVWTKLRFSGVRDKQGNPVRAICTAEVVTEYKKLEQRYQKALELREHTKSDNLILSCHCNISRDIILELEDQSGFKLSEKFGNERAAFFEGFSRLITDERKQQEFLQIFSSEPAKQNYELGKTQFVFECGIRYDQLQKDFQWVQMQMTTVKVPETNDIEGFMTVTDITDLKRQEHILESVLQCDYDFVANVNLMTDRLVIYRSSKADLEFLQCEVGKAYSYSEGVARAIDNYLVDTDKEFYRIQMNPEYIKNQLKDLDVFEFAYHVKDLEGDIRVKRARFTAYGETEELVVFSRTDITELMAEEEQKRNDLSRALELAEQATRSKSEFLSRMSHDLRTPMNGILGLTYLMEDQDDINEIKKSIPQVREAGEYLLQLINDVLDVNKIESGEVTLFPKPCNEEKVFPSIITMITPQLERKSIDFHFDKKNITWKYLIMDEQRVRQIFINLLSNAIKFTPDGGRVDFIMECISQTEDSVKDKFIVRDTGIGISREFLPKIFEPFTQENRFITSNTQGTGLGMAIVKKLVELMNGSISVKSSVNEGTEFTIYLDFKRAKKQEEMVQETTTISIKPHLPQGLKILLCEDHPLNAQIATRLLEKQGAIIIGAENGREAVEYFKMSSRNEYDVILMDIRMPEMDGLEAARQIRKLKREDAKTIPIIAMTANAFEEDVRKSEEAGMNAHLSKPIQPVKLYNMISHCLKEEE
ncbi:MAG: ATP-binding protein [Lachnospiraceae bacterium]|nr:ATP-binding protein [Lachnospiraceae bacterium]MDD3616737.1 ATP-binding protein [Lachnospiraceae bacterium]